MPNLRVKISGLCIFAFEPPPQGEEKPTCAHLLMQKLTYARVLNSAPHQDYAAALDQHFPLLVFSLPDRDSVSTRQTNFFAVPSADGKQMTKGVCVLFGDDVEVLPDGADGAPKNGNKNGGNGTSLQFDRSAPNPKDKANPTPEELRSLYWMATLQDAYPADEKTGKPAAEIDPVFYKNPPGANQAIVARVELKQGQLTTDQLTDHICTFVPPGNQKFNQKIALAFNWDIPFKDKVVIRTTKRIEGRVEPSDLVLTPSGHGDGDLEIEIKNMEIDELIGVSRSYSPRPEADFEVYADLLKDRSSRFPMGAQPPTYPRQVAPGNPAGVVFGTCPPAGG
ncbi:MAG TPA: hypothetical protein VGM86_15395 [Thermoanaerobaculia bacterium]|jgi:hypothetical protein